MKKCLFTVSFVFICLLSITNSKAGDNVCCNYTSTNNPFSCTTHSADGHVGDHGNLLGGVLINVLKFLGHVLVMQ